MNQITYRTNQDENNYNYNYNTIGLRDDEYYDEYYDFDCDEQQYEYEDAMGRPCFDTLIPAPCLAYTMARVNEQRRKEEALARKARAQEKARELRHKAYEARVAAEEIKFRAGRETAVKLSFFREQLAKLSLEEVAKSVRENVYTDETERKIANEVLLSKLPKFPTATLERMKKEEEERNKVEADAKFYTWRKGAKASSTSHTAW